jgi:hypothetical protein
MPIPSCRKLLTIRCWPSTLKARAQDLHDNMQENHVDVFDLLHVVHRGQYRGSHPAGQFSTIEAAQADRVSTKAIRVIDGLEDVG